MIEELVVISQTSILLVITPLMVVLTTALYRADRCQS
jgi:hypothetical protein